jgi:hypothetical protein
MRRWYLPLTVLGLGGIGVLLGTERGRYVVRRVSEVFEEAPQHLESVNATLDHEMANIQEAVDSIAAILGPAQRRTVR